MVTELDRCEGRSVVRSEFSGYSMYAYSMSTQVSKGVASGKTREVKDGKERNWPPSFATSTVQEL